MPTPDSPWVTAVRHAAIPLQNLCTNLQDAPVDDRLRALATLGRVFADLHDGALREAIIAAREQGWPLRRIATALDCSHEQVRIILTT